jgi:hypothetical protein
VGSNTSARHQMTLRLYEPSENRVKNKLCSSFDFLKMRKRFSCDLALREQQPSDDSALVRPFRKSSEEQTSFLSRFSEDPQKFFWPSGCREEQNNKVFVG